jgi:hypothetical protein
MDGILIQGTGGIRSHAQDVVDDVLAILRHDEIQVQQGDWTRVWDDELAVVVHFEGAYADGFRALALVIKADYPVVSLRRAWVVIGGELRGPRWEIVLGPCES